MKLLDKLRILKEIIILEGEGELYTNNQGNISINKHSIIISDYCSLDFKDSWIQQYIIKNNSYSELEFTFDILFCDAINNYQEYFTSKKGIKKFNL